jgi:hypothetical protein
MDIRGALQKLDPTNDAHWTADGLPRMDALEAVGLKGVTRGQVTAEAPTFTRFNTTLEEDGEDLPEGQDEPEVVESDEEPKGVSFMGESNDFAGAAPLAPPPEPPPPPPTEDELAAAEAVLAEAKAAAEEAKAAALKAQKERDRIVELTERQRTPQESQAVIMGYLAACQPKQKEGEAPTKHELAPIDKAHARPMGYGKVRPQYPTK